MYVFDYSNKSDDELCELFPDAQRALQGELNRRRITAEDVARVRQETKGIALQLYAQTKRLLDCSE